MEGVLGKRICIGIDLKSLKKKLCNLQLADVTGRLTKKCVRIKVLYAHVLKFYNLRSGNYG